MATRTGSRPPRKIFHKIGEVCDLTKTEPYVLRYWESEFPFLAPEKNRAGQRIYTDEDIETVLAIKRLLYEEGYTTAGARRRLEKEREDRASGAASASSGVAAGEETSAAAPSDDTHRAADSLSSPSPSPTPVPAPDSELRHALRDVRAGLRDLRSFLGGGAASPAAAPPDSESPPATKSRRRK